MTKKEAIERSIEDVNVYTTWNDGYNAWIQHQKPYSRHDLKCARIERALIYLGVPEDVAGHRAWISQEFDNLSFREAIYRERPAEKKLINKLIGSPLELCYHDDDGTEGAYWYIRGGEGGRTIAGSFETRKEAEKEYARLEKLIEKEIAGLCYELQR